jgi:hypothetical protein
MVLVTTDDALAIVFMLGVSSGFTLSKLAGLLGVELARRRLRRERDAGRR